MSKKVYSVLLLSLSLSGSMTCQNAMASAHDLVEELTEKIETFERASAVSSSPKSPSLLGHFMETASWAVGAGLRTTGDYLRTPSEGTSPKDVGLYGPLGNGLRSVGAMFTGETPTLARTLIDFWIDKNTLERPDRVIPYTVAALYCRGHAIEAILLEYGDFLSALGLRGYTTYTDIDGKILNGYFVKGLVAGFGRTPAMWETHTLEGFLGTLRANNIQIEDVINVCKHKDAGLACQEIFNAEKKKVDLETARRTTQSRAPLYPTTSPITIRRAPAVVPPSWEMRADPAPPPHLSAVPSVTPAPSQWDQPWPTEYGTSYPATSQRQTKEKWQ